MKHFWIWLPILLVLFLALLVTVESVHGFAPDPQSGTIQNEVRNQATPFGIGWGTLALINAGLAQGKNRSGLNWFLISLLLGPIATFMLIVFFQKQSSKTP